MIFLKGLLSGAWGYIVAAGAAIVAILAALHQAKKSGQNEVIAESAKKEVEDVKTAQKVEREIATAKPDAVADKLRKYQRD
jgi:crotonobetainyl-CoA:carnitine CoA-transferase CaiB-like acyl-CoA transferase